MLKKSLQGFVDEVQSTLPQQERDKLVKGLLDMISGWGEAASPELQEEYLSNSLKDIKRQFKPRKNSYSIVWVCSRRSRSDTEIQEEARRHNDRFVAKFVMSFSPAEDPDSRIGEIAKINDQKVSVHTQFAAEGLTEKMLRHVTASLGKANKHLAIAETRYSSAN